MGIPLCRETPASHTARKPRSNEPLFNLQTLALPETGFGFRVDGLGALHNRNHSGTKS